MTAKEETKGVSVTVAEQFTCDIRLFVSGGGESVAEDFPFWRGIRGGINAHMIKMTFPRAEPSTAVIVSLLSKTQLEISLVLILVF
ncbi:hypothetical protein V8G21_001728 [Salmonella enterica]